MIPVKAVPALFLAAGTFLMLSNHATPWTIFLTIVAGIACVVVYGTAKN